MIKRTLYFGNPVYLSLKNEQLVIQLQEVEQQSLKLIGWLKLQLIGWL